MSTDDLAYCTRHEAVYIRDNGCDLCVEEAIRTLEARNVA